MTKTKTNKKKHPSTSSLIRAAIKNTRTAESQFVEAKRAYDQRLVSAPTIAGRPLLKVWAEEYKELCRAHNRKIDRAKAKLVSRRHFVS